MSLAFSAERLTTGQIKVHLTWGDGNGLEGFVSLEELAQIGRVCELTIQDGQLVEMSAFTNGQAQVLVPPQNPLVPDAAEQRYHTEPRYRELVDWLRGEVASGAFTAQAIRDAAELVLRHPPGAYRERPVASSTAPTPKQEEL